HTASMKRSSQSCSNMVPSPEDPRICVGLAVLWAIAASSTHKHGLPRLCVGHLNLGRAKLFFHAYALLRRMCVALKTLRRSLPSTHMRAVLRICVALGRAS
ncbi:hypothetical protein PIB30_009397, partial [Stylosanthes scabra]|nr:hypothetical protein [Stylosanthes scabra]